MSGANPNWEITEELWEPVAGGDIYIVFEQETFWSARLLLGNGSEIEINACDEKGEHIDWPSRGTAKEICQAHHQLVLAGHTRETAAGLLMELSLEYLREKQGLAALVERGVRGHATH